MTPSHWKQYLKLVFASVCHYSGALTVYRRVGLNTQGLVLMYHRVLREPEVSDAIHPGMYVTERVFEQHIRYLLREYQVVTLDQLSEWLGGRRRFSRIPCAITFDDGWEDNYRNAFPILRDTKVPATVFLITAKIGQPGMLNWDQIEEMESAGIHFGSHTVSHRRLTLLAFDDVEQEFLQSQEVLRGRLKNPSTWLCYPNGDFNSDVCEIARRYFTAALTTRRGPLSQGDDYFQLRRIGIHNDVSKTIALFACRLALII